MNLTEQCQLIAKDIYNNLEHEQPELTYQNAFEVAFILDKIKYDREKDLPVYYRGIVVGRGKADFIVYGVDCTVVMELKAVVSWGETPPQDTMSQIHNYIKSFGVCHGLLINFPQSSKKDIPTEPECFIVE